jgi:hypothetical protein
MAFLEDLIVNSQLVQTYPCFFLSFWNPKTYQKVPEIPPLDPTLNPSFTAILDIIRKSLLPSLWPHQMMCRSMRSFASIRKVRFGPTLVSSQRGDI